jgi:co-chaperonin GroES (HSP10)
MNPYRKGQVVNLLGPKLTPVRNSDGSVRQYKIISCGKPGRSAKIEDTLNETTMRVAQSRLQPHGGVQVSETAKAEKTKATAVKTTKPKPEKINLKDFKKAGDEVWIKDFSEKFNSKRSDGKEVKAQAICVVAKDQKSFMCFNLYDGMGKLNKNGKLGNPFKLKEYDRKVVSLKKGGYTRYTASV